MLLLMDFFTELENINLEENQSWKMYEKYGNKKSYDPTEIIESRLEFNRKWKRIIRGIDLLTDSELNFLHSYFHGLYITGYDDINDRRLMNLIYQVENAA